MPRFFILLAIAFVLGTFFASNASAQALTSVAGQSGTAETSAPVVPEEMTKEAIDAMIARMSDDQVRDFLLQRLDAVAMDPAASANRMTVSERATMLWDAVQTPVRDAVRNLPMLVTREGQALRNFFGAYGGAAGVVTLFGLIALILAIGFAAERLLGGILSRRRNLDEIHTDDSLVGSVTYLFRRFIREILGLVVFFVVLRSAGLLLLTEHQIVFAGAFAGYLVWMPRLAAAASRFLLAPKRADLRLINADDETAAYLHRNLIGLVFLGGFTLFAAGFNLRAGIGVGEIGLAFWLDSAVYVYVALIAWTARDGLRRIMLGSDPDVTEFDRKVAQFFPYMCITVAGLMWVLVNILVGLNMVSGLIAGAHYYTMFLLLATPIIDTTIRGIVRHVVPPMQGEGATAEEAYRSTKRSYIRIGRVIAMGLVVVMIAHAWDTDYLSLLRESAGIADNLFSFTMTCIVGYVVYEGVSLWINRRLAAEFTAMGMDQEQAEAGEIGGAGQSRLSTVLPLALLTARGTIIVVFGLLAVGNLGIDITPLLAGAGIAGLAIGFGAQKLVSDVVSGVFFLVDDAFRIGEYVEIDGTMGSVEKISIRSMQLRHHRGPVHTIPYGEIPKLTNYSRDWVIMKLKFTVTFDTDPNKVKKIFKKIGAEMLEEPLYKDDFLQPFKSQGVFDIDDVGMVIRGKFMAKPGKQFMIRKEIYNRVKAGFAENGVEFARREVRVALPEGEGHEHLSDADKATLTAAAAAAAQQQETAPDGKKGGGPDG